jgi:hypothetical protein
LSVASIQESGRAVTQVAATTPAHLATSGECLRDLATAVHQLKEIKHSYARANLTSVKLDDFGFAHDRYTCEFAARV